MPEEALDGRSDCCWIPCFAWKNPIQTGLIDSDSDEEDESLYREERARTLARWSTSETTLQKNARSYTNCNWEDIIATAVELKSWNIIFYAYQRARAPVPPPPMECIYSDEEEVSEEEWNVEEEIKKATEDWIRAMDYAKQTGWPDGILVLYLCLKIRETSRQPTSTFDTAKTKSILVPILTPTICGLFSQSFFSLQRKMLPGNHRDSLLRLSMYDKFQECLLELFPEGIPEEFEKVIQFLRSDPRLMVGLIFLPGDSVFFSLLI